MFLLVIVCWGGVVLQVGFQMVDALADAEGISISGVSFKALFGKGRLFTPSCIQLNSTLN